MFNSQVLSQIHINFEGVPGRDTPDPEAEGSATPTVAQTPSSLTPRQSFSNLSGALTVAESSTIFSGGVLDFDADIAVDPNFLSRDLHWDSDEADPPDLSAGVSEKGASSSSGDSSQTQSLSSASDSGPHDADRHSGSDSDLSDEDFPGLEDIREVPCKGQIVTWHAGSVWDTYAYQQHDADNIGWVPIAIVDASRIILRAKDCTGELEYPDEITDRTCRKCQQLLNSATLRRFMNRAGDDNPPIQINWKYLNTRQLKAMLSESRTRTKVMSLKVSNFYNLCHYLVE